MCPGIFYLKQVTQYKKENNVKKIYVISFTFFFFFFFFFGFVETIRTAVEPERFLVRQGFVTTFSICLFCLA